jgi:hypothetical protein
MKVISSTQQAIIICILGRARLCLPFGNGTKLIDTLAHCCITARAHLSPLRWLDSIVTGHSGNRGNIGAIAKHNLILFQAVCWN